MQSTIYKYEVGLSIPYNDEVGILLNFEIPTTYDYVIYNDDHLMFVNDRLNAIRYENSSIGIVQSQTYVKQCVADGTSYQVRMLWGSKYIEFTVPAGSNIFQQTENLNISINDLITNDGNITFGQTGIFCHACVTGSDTKWGDTCWAITPSSDNNRQIAWESGI